MILRFLGGIQRANSLATIVEPAFVTYRRLVIPTVVSIVMANTTIVGRVLHHLGAIVIIVRRIVAPPGIDDGLGAMGDAGDGVAGRTLSF